MPGVIAHGEVVILQLEQKIEHEQDTVITQHQKMEVHIVADQVLIQI